MKTHAKIIGTWLVIAALTSSAFTAGAWLRGVQNTSAATQSTSLQANALLKLMPECSPVSPSTASKVASENRELVGGVLKLLKTHYVEPITAERETAMARGAARGMLDSLTDPDSRFLDPTQRELLADAAAGKFHGIGAVLALRNDKVDKLEVTKLLVVAPMPGSPAEKAGLQSGDSITHIDGKWIARYDPFKEADLEKLEKAAYDKEVDWFTYQKAFEEAYKKLKEGLNISDALQTLTASSSGEIAIRVERPKDGKPVEFKLTCGDTEVDPVTSRALNRGIVYIRITQFNARAVKEFAAELERARASHAKGFILDLRDNPGGLMDAAADVASTITGGGVIASIQDGKGRHPIVRPQTQALRTPVVVLVNGGTASVAELVAGTLRDRGAATIVGTKTFGDGLTQTPLLLTDGSAAILTTGKMLTAKGFDFDGKGLTPDKEAGQDERQGDTQLKEAEKLLLAKLGKA